jgi:adenylate cyclase class IV
MKLIYNGKRKFRILFPEYHEVSEGYVIETDDKLFAKELKTLGFEEVQETKKSRKAGDK